MALVTPVPETAGQRRDRERLQEIRARHLALADIAHQYGGSEAGSVSFHVYASDVGRLLCEVERLQFALAEATPGEGGQ